MSESGPTTCDVLVIGAGFAGIGSAIRLQRAGVTDVVLLEAASEVGGTWRDNTYPGAACDIASHLYSFSFAPRTNWSRKFAPHDEIQKYVVDTADAFQVRERIRFGRRVEKAVWDAARSVWVAHCDTGEQFEARVLLNCLGGLRDPAIPDIPGLDRFQKPMMHSCRWDHDVDLENKRVGVIGTGASAIQIVPEVARVAENLTLFQRTPPWILPRDDFAYSDVTKRAFRVVPGLRWLHRLILYVLAEMNFLVFSSWKKTFMPLAMKRARAHLRTQVPDDGLRAKLTPDYEIGCKRILLSDTYYPALARDNVDVVTNKIVEITEEGAVLEDGNVIELDALILATGFSIRSPLGHFDIVGRDGQHLSDRWRERPSAYMGASIPGFPNLFVLIGPNSALGHNSMIFMMEAQLNMVVDGIRQMLRPDVGTIEVTEEALQAFVDEVDQRTRSTVWGSGCQGWYFLEDGRNFTLWPGSTVEFWWRTRRFHRAGYEVVRRTSNSKDAK